MAYSEDLDEEFGPEDFEPHLGWHLGCGGTVYGKSYRGAYADGLKAEPDETVCLCNECGEELSDEEITEHGDGFPCPECNDASGNYPGLCDNCKANEEGTA